MKKNKFRFSVILAAVCGLLTLPVFADLGLAQLAAGPQGGPAVGQAVLAAAKAVYANNTDPALIQQQLIAILNEAAATGNEQAIRYAIVAVMMAGGEGAMSQSIAAINNSNVFARYPSLTAVTVAAVEVLMGGGGTDGQTGGGETGGGGGETGGGTGGGSANSFLAGLGLDPDNPFTWGSLTGPGDGDVDATPK
jgi:hypothetical protein